MTYHVCLLVGRLVGLSSFPNRVGSYTVLHASIGARGKVCNLPDFFYIFSAITFPPRIISLSFSVLIHMVRQGHIISQFPPPPVGGFLFLLKNSEEFEGGLEKRKGKGVNRRKKKRVIKHTLNYLYEF